MRRRKLQQDYNAEHGINPQTVRKAVTDILEALRPAAESPVPANKKKRSGNLANDLSEMPHEDLQRLVHTLEAEMVKLLLICVLSTQLDYVTKFANYKKNFAN